MASLIVHPRGPLRGVLSVPGDKSITHRAILLGSLAEGEGTIAGYCRGEDCLSTLRAVQALGISTDEQPDRLTIRGKGLRGFREPELPLDCGNSGTGLRLLTGVVAGQDFFTVLTGDASLRRRPMRRIVEPLRAMGATIAGRKNGELAPLAVTGVKLRGCPYTLPVASAQVKSSLLLAGLVAEGVTELREPARSRDHTERLFRYFGIALDQERGTIRLEGGQEFRARDMTIPGDFSAAAFFLVGATIVPGSDLVIEGVGVNPTRTGLLDLLREMGADIQVLNQREDAGEPVADLRVRSARLCGITIDRERLLPAIDEFPILCVAAALADGDTIVTGAEELRVKESDRISSMAEELHKMGADVHETPDGIRIKGVLRFHGARCDSRGDHRVAMACAVAGLVAEPPVTCIEDTACIETSFPEFEGKLLELLTKSP